MFAAELKIAAFDSTQNSGATMRPALVLMCLSLFTLGCTPVASLSDDEVLAAWEKENDTTLRDKKYFDVKRPDSFKDVALCGCFAHDYGMKDSGMFVGATYTTTRDGAADVLAAAGWASGDDKARGKLAMAYVTEILCAWHAPMSETNDDFNENNKHKFTAMEASTADGKTIVTFWIAGRVGMNPDRDYFKQAVTFDANGKISEHKTLETFTAIFERK
jgi:hypothetical protein